MIPTRYAAFISYAHADEAIAARLHKALETYGIPKAYRTGAREKLSPIFRDAAELTAHHSLSDKIETALADSRWLIVLCSPAAKASHWVNEEIRLFRKLYGDEKILCVLAQGTPQTAFPDPLIDGGREPLAANLGQSREGFQLGVTQLAASMLGVGLDDLIQRAGQRKRQRLQAITAASLGLTVVMGAMTYSAVQARDAAETSRAQAEDLVEYMITDLKDKLEPVGRLDVLGGVGDKAVAYYEGQDITKLPDESLARQARSRHVLGHVAIDMGDMEKAQREIQSALELTEAVYQRRPHDMIALFAHAQSQYQLGALRFSQNDFTGALEVFKARDNLTDELMTLEPKNPEWLYEGAIGANYLGWTAQRLLQSDEAITYFDKAIKRLEAALVLEPDSRRFKVELTDIYAGRATVELINGTADDARYYKKLALDIFEDLEARYPDDKEVAFDKVLGQMDLYRIFHLKRDSLVGAHLSSMDDLLALINHDPDNAFWRAHYVRQYFSHHMKSASINFENVRHFENIMRGFTPDNGVINSFAKDIYQTAFKSHYYIENGEANLAKQDIDRLNELVLAHKARSPHEENWSRMLFDLNRQAGNADMAKRFARKYLSNPYLQGGESYPTVEYLRARLGAALDPCAPYKARMIALEARGYEPPDFETQPCELE